MRSLNPVWSSLKASRFVGGARTPEDQADIDRIDKVTDAAVRQIEEALALLNPPRPGFSIVDYIRRQQSVAELVAERFAGTPWST